MKRALCWVGAHAWVSTLAFVIPTERATFGTLTLYRAERSFYDSWCTRCGAKWFGVPLGPITEP